MFYTTYGAFPTTGISTEDLAYATDTGRLYRWNGTAWQPITGYVVSGNYVGDSSVNKAIAHGLGRTPGIVFIIENAASPNGRQFRILGAVASIFFVSASPSAGNYDVTIPNATNFYVGNATNYQNSANYTGSSYYWVAM